MKTALFATDWEVEVVVLRERLVRKWIVDAYSYDLCVYLVQLLHIITQGAHFTGADGGECSWEESQQGCTVGFQKFVKAARFSVGVGE